MITARSFPTPDLALRAGADRAAVGAFAQEQATAAEAARIELAAAWRRGGGIAARITALRAVHAGLVHWRYTLARRTGRRLGHGLAHDAERFRMSLREGGANYDRLGEIGRLREGGTWDPAARTYRGGTPTPASEIMRVYGAHARARFEREEWLPDPDVLLTVVSLPRGRMVAGNRLVRGAAARRIAHELVARVAARGADASRMDIGGELIYAVTADPGDADRLFDAGLKRLAAAVDDPDRTARVTAWQDARYLLYQGIRTKKGSDAVTRTFVVAVGAVLLGTAPVLDQDIDLRCMVLGQDDATRTPANAALALAH
uniref:hypothetical protein n=1 Tax=Amycolatopsis sp. CA-151526 TaxID=3239921 RepID=UPI003F497001